MSETKDEEEGSPGVGTGNGKEEVSGSTNASALHSNGTTGSPFIVPAIGHSADPQATEFSCYTPGFVDQSQLENQLSNDGTNDVENKKAQPREELEVQEGVGTSKHMSDAEPATAGDETCMQSGEEHHDEARVLGDDNNNLAMHPAAEVDAECGAYTAYSGSVVDSDSEREEINREEDIQDSYLKAAKSFTGYVAPEDQKLLDDETENELDPNKAWVPPSKEKAKEYADVQKFERGKAPIFGTRSRNISRIGAGVGLYFKFRAHLCCVFFLMTMISIPSFIIMNSGRRLPDGEQGILGLGSISLGNLGHSSEHLSEFNKENCRSENRDGCETGGTIYIESLGESYTLPEMSNAVMWIDLLYSAFFMIFVVCISNVFEKEVDALTRVTVSPDDYTVMVRGFPPSTTREELKEHFSSRYNLFVENYGKPGWCREGAPRPPLRPESDEVLRELRNRRRGTELGENPNYRRETAEAVKTTAHTDLKGVMGTCVADVQVAYPIGDLIRKYRKIENLSYKMKLAISMYQKVPQRSKVIYANKAVDAQEKLLSVQSEATAKRSNDTIFGFVTFNNEESFRRCTEDYQRSTYPLAKWFQARHLRFGESQCPIEVTRAVQPGNIIWENLETTAKKRAIRGILSFLIVVGLLAISFALNFGLSVAQQNFQDALPGSTICDQAIPIQYYGSEENIPDSVHLRRLPDIAESECGKGFYYLTLACRINGEAKTFQECQDHQQNQQDRRMEVAPKVEGTRILFQANSSNAACLDPCFSFSKNDHTKCRVDVPQKGSVSFERNSIPLCYCAQRMRELIALEGPFFFSELRHQEEGVCDEFLDFFINEQVLVVVTTFAVVLVSSIISVALKASAKFERHWTVSSELKSQVKSIVLAQIINMSVVIIIINTDFGSGSSGLFAGEFSSFEYRWYVAVGVPIVLTMIMDSIFSHSKTLFQAHILFPFKRWYASKTTHSQTKLSKAYTPESFNLSDRYSALLTSVFITMMFSTGMPLLLPIACFAHFLAQWIDKWALLRVYIRPSSFDANVSRLVVRMLPIALGLHYIIGFWMMGDDDIASENVLRILLESGRRSGYEEVDAAVDEGRMEEATQLYYDRFKDRVGGWDKVGLLPRLVKASALPLFLGFLTIVAYYLLKLFGIWPFIRWPISRILNILACGKCSTRKSRADNLNPPFSANFYKSLLPYESNHLTRKEEKAGWLIAEDPFRGERTKMKIRLWMTDGVFASRVHRVGDRMKTYEVIGQYQVYSYDIRRNPKYEAIVTPILTGSEELEEQQAILRKEMSDLISADIKKIIEIGESKGCCWRKLYYFRSGVWRIQNKRRIQPVDLQAIESGEARKEEGQVAFGDSFAATDNPSKNESDKTHGTEQAGLPNTDVEKQHSETQEKKAPTGQEIEP